MLKKNIAVLRSSSPHLKVIWPLLAVGAAFTMYAAGIVAQRPHSPWFLIMASATIIAGSLMAFHAQKKLVEYEPYLPFRLVVAATDCTLLFSLWSVWLLRALVK